MLPVGTSHCLSVLPVGTSHCCLLYCVACCTKQKAPGLISGDDCADHLLPSYTEQRLEYLVDIDCADLAAGTQCSARATSDLVYILLLYCCVLIWRGYSSLIKVPGSGMV